MERSPLINPLGHNSSQSQNEGGLPTQPLRAAEAGVPDGEWKRVHPLSPILNSWQVLAVLFAVLFFQNIQNLRELSQFIASEGLSAAIIIGAGSLLLLVILIFLISFLSWRATSYAVTDRAVWMRTGILFRQQRHIRLERIQAVDVIHPFLGRIVGLGRLNVEAAGGAGSSLSIGYLKTSDLDDLRAEILARAAGLKIDEVAPTVDAAEPGMASGSISLEAPEKVLYAITSGRLLASILLSGTFLWSAFFILLAITAGIVFQVLGGQASLWGWLPLLVPALIVSISVLWSKFSSEFNFQAAVSPDGIRIRRGLLESRAETIPPRRVHAVKVTQPLLWRMPGWYKVQISQASARFGGSGNQSMSSSLLPVGTKEEALLALWLVLPDLGVDDANKFFEDATSGTKPNSQFYGVSQRARWFDPLVYKRRGLALTRTSAVLRDGRIVRRASFVAYERIQSQKLFHGPIDGRLAMVSLSTCLVPGEVHLTMVHLPNEAAEEISARLVTCMTEARSSEPPERWLQRVEKEIGPLEEGGAQGDGPDAGRSGPADDPNKGMGD